MFNGQKECESFSNQLMLSMPFKLNSKFGTRSKDISTRETSLNISDIKSPVLKYEPKSRAGKKKVGLFLLVVIAIFSVSNNLF